MTEPPEKSLKLYRGFVVYFYQAAENVVELAGPGGGPWQSKEKLEAALKAKVKEKHPDVTLPKDVGGYIETIDMELVRDGT